jgi:hypothetical protein
MAESESAAAMVRQGAMVGVSSAKIHVSPAPSLGIGAAMVRRRGRQDGNGTGFRSRGERERDPAPSGWVWIGGGLDWGAGRARGSSGPPVGSKCSVWARGDARQACFVGAERPILLGFMGCRVDDWAAMPCFGGLLARSFSTWTRSHRTKLEDSIIVPIRISQTLRSSQLVSHCAPGHRCTLCSVV